MKKNKNKKTERFTLAIATPGAVMLYAGFMLLAVLTGCTAADTDSDVSFSTEKIPLHIAAASVERNVFTRAVGETELSEGSIIGLFRRRDGNANYNLASNVPYRLTDASWEPVNPGEAIYLRTQTASLGAVYPYGGLPATGTAVKLSSCEWAAGKEVFYAPFTASFLSPIASFTMKHVYSRVNILFKRDKDQYTGAGTVSTFALAGTGIYSGALLDVTKALDNNPFSDYESPGYTLTGFTRTASLKGEANDAGGNDKLDLLMVPASLSGKVTLIATIDGKPMTLGLDASQFGGSLQAGMRYNIIVTVRGTALWISSIEFAGWDETPVGDGSILDSEFE